MKRAFDIIVSLLGLIFLSPIFAVLFILIRFSMGSPVLFRQMRPGKDAKPFKMIKFRSMKNAFDKNGDALRDSLRLTPVGSFLRSLSLDEIPALYNVLIGQMSLVGPRPLLMEYLELYSAEQARRHEVLPGITGWAQVNGRNSLSWEEKFKLDVWYVDNRSFWLDLKIIALTFKLVITRESVSEKGHATMSKFRGSK